MRRTILLVSVVAVVLAWVAMPVAGAAAGARTYVTKEFVRGASIHGSNGLAVDPSGRVIVASVFGSELIVVDPQTGHVSGRIDEAVDSPDDVAVGPDGSIYWTDIIIGEVGRLEPDGTVTKQFVAPGMNPIAFTADGRLFVGQAFFGDGLYELDPTLTGPPRVVIPDSTVPPFLSQLNGFDFGPDGMLYAPQPFLGKIVRIDPETGAMQIVTDDLAGLFPTSVEFDSRGQLHASLSDGDIIRIDPETGTYRVVAHIPNAVLDNMVFDARDRLFVSDSDDGTVYRIASGQGVRTLVPGGLILPGGLAIMDTGSGRDSLFAADVWSLAEFDARSGRLLEVDRQSRAGGGIVEPWTVAPDSGNVVLTSWMSNAVQIWDPVSNESVEVFTDFAVPLNAIRFQGDLVVSQLGTGSVAREDAETGARSTIAAGLYVPTGLAATEDDLWVADWATGVVWQIVADGLVLDPPAMTAARLSSPEGMAVDVDGSLLVVESGAGRLMRIDPASGEKTTVVEGLALGLKGSAGAPPTWALCGVAVTGTGTIFVSGDAGNVVYRLHPIMRG